MMKLNLGFIGGGNMAAAIIGGLANNPDYELFVSDPDAGKLNELSKKYGIHPLTSNQKLIETADVVVLAVKPQLMAEITTPLAAPFAQRMPLIISIAAGIRCQQILTWLDKPQAACIRVMPNTPALIQHGASGLYGKNCSDDQRSVAELIMSTVGVTVWLEDEQLMDSVTAVSGSGPAYFFLLMESVYNAAISNHLSAEQARQLTLQTALGAAGLAASSNVDFATLRQQVTSPGGTTEAAIKVMQQNGFAEIVEKAVSQAAQRSRELSQE